MCQNFRWGGEGDFQHGKLKRGLEEVVMGMLTEGLRLGEGGILEFGWRGSSVGSSLEAFLY